MPKEFKSNIAPLTEDRLAGMLKPSPFKKCPSCGNSIISSATFCNECKRLRELGMRDSVPQFVQANPQQDTQEKQSFRSDNHAGYRDTNPTPASKKFPVGKERV